MPSRILIFFAVMTVVVVLLHAYVGWRAGAPFHLGPRGKRRLRLLLAFSALSILATFTLGRLLHPSLATRMLNWVGFTAMGTISILFGLYVVRDTVLLATRLFRRRTRGGAGAAGAAAEPPGVTRRDVLVGASNLAVLGAGGLLGAGSLVQAARDPVVEVVPVSFPGLPDGLAGLRIAQISDLHVGPTLGEGFCRRVVEQVLALQPDLIAVTGDLIDGRVDDIGYQVASLADLRAPLGTYFVTGNHEYYWDAPAWVAYLRSLGLDVLVNEHRVLRRGDATLVLGGVTDLKAHTILPAHRSDPARAFRNAPAGDLRLLLAHQPASLYGAQEAGVDLQLSGHTHGGQIFPMNLLVHLAHPIVEGLGLFGKTRVYVNRGTAYWGPPMRTGRRGEITLVELVRADDEATVAS